MTEEMETIDMTPSWMAILGMVRSFTIGAPNQTVIHGFLKELEKPCSIVDKMNMEAKANAAEV